eukprot:TRINITY_DN1848_c0_g1_i1.p1 TRINITY_DN1848_c0_g1~~TRINITY_DN1848_c0_g1_i1.p1  ORF type:complete len:234 (-),score=-4.64 TRINITY_DN1848_c0_g1_i1:196-861(-)
MFLTKLLFLLCMIMSPICCEPEVGPHLVVRRAALDRFDLGETIMTILGNFKAITFIRLLGINTMSVFFNIIGLSLITIVYEILTAGSSPRNPALDKVFAFQSMIGFFTRFLSFYVWALIGFTIVIAIVGLDDPAITGRDPIDFIINDMFGFAFSFVGINPNVARVMMVAIIQFIGWTTVAMVGLSRFGSSAPRRKKRSPREPEFIYSTSPYFILDSLSKFD